MQASEVTGTLFERLSFHSERNKVISSNIANLNTPNYKTKELVFENELKKASSNNDLQMVKTHHSHITGSLEQSKPSSMRVETVKGLTEQNDGNNVSLDREVGNMAKNSMLFDALSNAIKKDSRLFRSVLESSQKL